MSKISLITAMVIVGLGASGASILPAAAQNIAACQSEKVLNGNGVYVDRVQVFAGSIATLLRQQGYNVSSVEPWGGCVRAFITQPGGGTKFQYFDPDTLQPLN